MSMKHIVMMSEDDFKEIVCATKRLRTAVNLLETNYMAGELDTQLERIEKCLRWREADES